MNRFIILVLFCIICLFPGCKVDINVTRTEIRINQGSKIIPCSTGSYDFGNVTVNSSSSAISFTVENIGMSNLYLLGSPILEIKGQNSSEFSTNTSSTSRTIIPGNNTTFTITFRPTSTGNKTATVLIPNNDRNENPYTFTIKGNSVAVINLPEINVKQGSNNIFCTTGSYDFGNTFVGSSSVNVVFTIENLGTIDLKLIGSPNMIIKNGNDISLFTIDQNATNTPVPAGFSTTFTISFKPADIGAKSITILISNNDSDENPYTFTVTGTGTKEPLPEINLKQGSNNIPTFTGSYSFGSLSVNSSSEAIIFTIENTGYADLNLTGSPIVVITGINAFEFSVNTSSTNTTITPGNSTTFTIILSPTNVGNKAATVSIANNDSDENPYTFTISGIGTTAVPEINLKQGSNNIVCTTGSFDFHGVRVGSSSSVITFTIENTGYGNLNLTGSPIVGITGTNASQFIANTNLTNTTITYGNSTTFTITFSPTSTGNKIASVSIVNNDSDENPYTFTIKGTGSIYTAGDVNGDGYPDTIVGAYGDDDGGTYSGCAFIFFGRQNWNSTIDASNADVKLVGEDAGDYFGRSVSFAGDVNNDGYGDVIVGAPYDDDGGSSSGCAFIFFGRQNWNSTIDASNANVKLVGEDTGDIFGYSASLAGDVNNDGYDDVIVGAYADDDGGGTSGCAFIFFGKQNWSSSIDASNADVKLIGENAADYFSTSSSYAGDVNNDGYDDVIVGAYSADNGGSNSGCAYIFFGRSNWSSSIDGFNADVKLIGEIAGDYLGYSVSHAGDVNNDGFDDVIVGAHAEDTGGTYAGCAYIFFGRQSWNSSIDASNANVKLIGEDAGDYFGRNVSFAGDINNDGYDDVLVGVSYDDDGGAYSGCAFIFLGRQNWSSSIDASNADVKLIGADAGDYFGYTVSYIQDVNNDGYDDFIVGAPSDDDGGSYSGCAFIFLGRQNWSSNIDASNADVKLIGEDAGDAFGSVSGR